MSFMITATKKVIYQYVAKALLVASGTTVGTLFANGMPAQAAIFTFFGEDMGLGEETRLPSTPNSDAARNSFLANLGSSGTETFESFSNGTEAPLTLNFPGEGSATLTGNGNISTVPTGTNRVGRYPISGVNYFDTDGIFAVEFNTAQEAFGFYGTDIGDFSGQVTLTLANGANSVLTIPNMIDGTGGSTLFYGFIATDPNEFFTKVTFGSTTEADFFGFDNVTIGRRQPATRIPEPDSVLGMLALSLLGAVSATLKCQQKGIGGRE